MNNKVFLNGLEPPTLFIGLGGTGGNIIRNLKFLLTSSGMDLLSSITSLGIDSTDDCCEFPQERCLINPQGRQSHIDVKNEKNIKNMMQQKTTILLIDDDLEYIHALSFAFRKHYDFEEAAGVKQLREKLNSKEHFDLILLDLVLEKSGEKIGLDLIPEIQEKRPGIPIIVVTGNSDYQTAVEALYRGAQNFLYKGDYKYEVWDATFQQVIRDANLKSKVEELEKENKKLQEIKDRHEFIQHPDFPIIGGSPQMERLRRSLKIAAEKPDLTVMITGDTGVGKSIAAHSLHYNSSQRHKHPFEEIFISNIAKRMLEAELFGAKKGSYTDLKEDRTGRLELANQGIVFLDEIGDLDPNSQGKLLQFLQKKTIWPLDAKQDIVLDVQVLTATNKIMPTEVAEGRFRKGLYERLNIFPIEIPLCGYYHSERLQNFFINKVNRIFLAEYDWSGNVRELRKTKQDSDVAKKLKSSVIEGYFDVYQPHFLLHPLTFLSNSNSSLIKSIRSDKISNQLERMHRERAIISILIDSYAYNISAHSLTVLKWWYQQRIGNRVSKNIRNNQLIENCKTLIATFQKKESFKIFNWPELKKIIQSISAKWYDHQLLKIRKEKLVISHVHNRLISLKNSLNTLVKNFLDRKTRWDGIYSVNLIMENFLNIPICIFDKTHQLNLFAIYQDKICAFEFFNDWLVQSKFDYYNEIKILEKSDNVPKFSHVFGVPNQSNPNFAIHIQYSNSNRTVEAFRKSLCVFDKIEEELNSRRLNLMNCLLNTPFNKKRLSGRDPIIINKLLNGPTKNRRYSVQKVWEFFEKKIVKIQDKRALITVDSKILQAEVSKKNKEISFTKEVLLLRYKHEISASFDSFERISQVAIQETYFNHQVKKFISISEFKPRFLDLFLKSEDNFDLQIRA
ncbi:sigma-54-dependent transcriptional regulator [Flavilitoribacter nigricans]|nr:sigma 54-interacting transcriptional regulator [Flavilitoribacter nigricans]